MGMQQEPTETKGLERLGRVELGLLNPSREKRLWGLGLVSVVPF